jgi:hypothetical protein
VSVTLPQNNPIIQTIKDIILSIDAYDELEQEHIDETLKWIRSGAPLFRTEKPATPPKHLVPYFVLIDEAVRKVLLVDHKKANCGCRQEVMWNRVNIPLTQPRGNASRSWKLPLISGRRILYFSLPL